MVAAATAAAVTTILAVGGIAQADTITDSVVDTSAGLTLIAGGASAGASITLVVDDNGTDAKNGCNVGPNKGSLVLDITAPSGGTATPSQLTISACNTAYPVSFAAGTLGVSGTATAKVNSATTATGLFTNNVSIPITVNQPAPPTPTNTPPTVNVSGVTNGGSYEINAVPSATCSVTDAEDGPSSFPATITGALTHGLGAQTASCDYTDYGGIAATTATASYTVVDTGNPVVTNSLDPASVNGSNGWYTSNVTVSYGCSDPDKNDVTKEGSGVVSCPTAESLGEGQHVSKTVDIHDYAGNKGSTTVPAINIDKTAPVVSANGVASGTVGDHGWYTSDVTGSFTATDNLSGFDAQGTLTTSADGTTTSGEGRGKTSTSPAFTDQAGNTTSAGDKTQSFNVDTSGPGVAVDGDVAASGTSGTNGWYTSDVTVTFLGTDIVSGFDAGGFPTKTDTATTSTEGSAVTVDSPAFTDYAGNTTAQGAVTSNAFKIDKTAPATPTFVGGPADNGAYVFGTEPAKPTCTSSDLGSGLAGCDVTGGGTSVGTHTYTATATDNAGLRNTATVSYSVLPYTVSGFYAPVDMNGVVNTVKAGSTVPMKFEVFQGSTELTTTSAVKSFGVAPVTCSALNSSTDDIEVTTTGGTSLRYDSTAGQFIQNWQTPKSVGSCYRVTMTAQDSASALVAYFKLK